MEDLTVLPTKVVTTVVNVNSFISTLDHLPCDIVRSLWLIQSLNFKIHDGKLKLGALLKQPKTPQSVSALVATKVRLQRYSLELVEESKHLKAKLQWHKNFLTNDRDTMDKLVEMRKQMLKNGRLDFEKFKSDFFRDLDQSTSFMEYFEKHFGGPVRPSRHGNSSSSTDGTLPASLGSPSAHKPKITIRLPVIPKLVKEEPTYCLCHGVSFGKMIACDNIKCETEWFHYKCVGLTQAPKGKWYCPSCAKHKKTLKKKRHKGF
ncbi:unnamed protein product [Kuraishia capsulata CBS 1993]|uniref:PHD-type domain-containing protein n=1 Tax=Kuraishia capsulata CBS 1993 TaxID=1382522 RepID=W6MH30_9ASCO|nr:uncharacterized protein KUCA_T00001469001 [Kuraishia capsulata CBS 1993]CDK25499.1 unnamed protein product [Kuraishia capsulata CBS 1993]